MKPPNIYQMIEQYGDDPLGLWVIRNSWSNCIARILSAEPAKGLLPYCGNSRVECEVYTLSGYVRESFDNYISCPGTFAYKRVSCPQWGMSYPHPKLVAQLGDVATF
jgi:hypothetical protein